MEFTKEQLIRRAHLTVSRGARELENHPDRDGVAADIKIASIAARALMAEPIYQLWDQGYYDTEKEIYDAALKAGGRGRIVYTAPPEPANVDPIAWLWSHRKHPGEVSLVRPEDDERAEGAHWSGWSCQALYAAPQVPVAVPAGYRLQPISEYDAMCAAMLQGAEPVSNRDELRVKVRREHAEWSQATFGDVGPVGPLKHLSKEALEAAAEPGDLSEWADMQFLLWDAQRRAGISDGEITAAMEEKLKVNIARQWPEPKDGEPRLHIKAAPQQEVKP